MSSERPLTSLTSLAPLTPLTPLTAIGPLRIAVVGRGGAGKTSLVQQLVKHAHHVIAQPRQPIPPIRPQHPILARLAASRLGTVVGRTARVLFSFARLLQRQPPSCTRHDLLPAPDATPITILDAHGEDGLHSLKADADEVDIVLFVTRLDDTRAHRQDKTLLGDVVDVFGKDVLDRLMFVLTHGCALPPVNLTFEEFVGGRSDLLASFVRLVWPPVVVPTLLPGSQDGAEGSEGHLVGEEAPLVSGSIIINASEQPENIDDDEIVEGERQLLRFGPRTAHEPEESTSTPAVQSVVAALVNDDDTDEGSVSAIPEDFIDSLYQAGVHPDDKRTFKDPITPPIAVVELSDACPTDKSGEGILPDGTRWFSNLVTKISELSQDAPRKAEERVARKEEAESHLSPMKFSSRFREMFSSLSQDTLRIILVQITLVIIAWQVGSAINRSKEQKEAAAEEEDDDVLLALSDEEFEALTKPDPGSGGTAVLRFDDGKDDELDLEESEEEFFGRAEKKRRTKRPSSIQEIPVPRPHIELPFGAESEDEKAGIQPPSTSGVEKKPADHEKNNEGIENDTISQGNHSKEGDNASKQDD